VEGAPATLKEIGVDQKLSAKAKQAAAVGDDDCAMRDKMASGEAIIVDPIGIEMKLSLPSIFGWLRGLDVGKEGFDLCRHGIELPTG
jgi:hypothetical protein